MAKKNKMPSETVRLDRIAKNLAKLPKKQRRNITQSVRGGEIAKHASGKAGLVSDARPQDRIKRS